MNKPIKGKRTYWFTDVVTAAHKERADKLLDAGLQVTFFIEAQEFLGQVTRIRPSIIIVDDRPQMEELEHHVRVLCSLPELRGVRMLLNIAHHRPGMLEFAVSSNFRDIVPFDLPLEQWLNRIQYSTGGKPMAFALPLAQQSVNQIAALHVPGRIVWMSPTHIRFETRCRMQVGHSYHISGYIAESLGLKNVTLHVEATFHTQLIYRFSQAVLARWQVPEETMPKADKLLASLKASHAGARFRIFVAIQDMPLRQELLVNMESGRFEVSVALHRANLKDEFTYFAPELVFFDGRLLVNMTDLELKEALDRLPSGSTAVVIGNKEDFQRIGRLNPSLHVYRESRPPRTVLSHNEDRYNLRAKIRQDDTFHGGHVQAYHIAPDHPLSRMYVDIPVRVRRLHPYTGSLAMPYLLNQFALAKLSVPFIKQAIGRDLFIKVLDIKAGEVSDQSAEFPHQCDFLFIDPMAGERNSLCSALLQYYKAMFLKQGLYFEDDIKSVREVEIISQSNANIKPPLVAKVASLPSIRSSTKTDVVIPAKTQPVVTISSSRAPREEEFPNLLEAFMNLLTPDVRKGLVFFIVTLGFFVGVLLAAMNLGDRFYTKSGSDYSQTFKNVQQSKLRPKPSDEPESTNDSH